MSTLPVPSGAADAALPLVSPGRWLLLKYRLKEAAGNRLSYSLADQIAYSFGNMIVAALISRHCAQRDFGIYILTQRSMDVLIQLSNVFLWAPFTFNLPGTPEERRSLYQGSILNLQIAFCLLFTLLLWIGSRWAAAPSRSMYYGTFAPLVLTSGGILFREFTRRMYFAHLRLKEAFWTEVATVLLQIAGVEWLFTTGRLTVANTLWVLCLGALAVSLWWIVRDWRGFSVSYAEMLRDLRLNLRLGRWFLGSNMIFLASSQCNPWVLGGLLGGSAVGAYAVCESVVNIPRVAMTSVQNVMGPVIARAHNEGGKLAVGREVRRLDRTLLIGSVSCTATIVLTGPWIAQLIFGSVPGHARVVLVLLSMNLVAFASTMAQSFGLAALHRADTTVYANAIGLLAQAAVCYFLVRSFHVSGAAAAMLVGSLVVLLVRGAFFRREMAVA